jgi:hypothetical protein
LIVAALAAAFGMQWHMRDQIGGKPLALVCLSKHFPQWLGKTAHATEIVPKDRRADRAIVDGHGA